jgi:hypothetical protein
VRSIPAYRIRCPEHVAFLTSIRAYEAYVEYWNSKADDASADHRLRRRTANPRQSQNGRSIRRHHERRTR